MDCRYEDPRSEDRATPFQVKIFDIPDHMLSQHSEKRFYIDTQEQKHTACYDFLKYMNVKFPVRLDLSRDNAQRK